MIWVGNFICKAQNAKTKYLFLSVCRRLFVSTRFCYWREYFFSQAILVMASYFHVFMLTEKKVKSFALPEVCIRFAFFQYV